MNVGHWLYGKEECLQCTGLKDWHRRRLGFSGFVPACNFPDKLHSKCCCRCRLCKTLCSLEGSRKLCRHLWNSRLTHTTGPTNLFVKVFLWTDWQIPIDGCKTWKSFQIRPVASNFSRTLVLNLRCTHKLHTYWNYTFSVEPKMGTPFRCWFCRWKSMGNSKIWHVR